MASYAMYGNGTFGGSSNFLSQLGGIGNAWGDGIASGIKMGTALMNYDNAVATNPSALRAEISKNIAAQGTNEGIHYRNYMMNGILSQLAAGKPLTDQQRQLINGGYVQGIGNNTGGLTAQVEGTPVNTNGGTPATQPATMPVTTVARTQAPTVQLVAPERTQHWSANLAMPATNYGNLGYGVNGQTAAQTLRNMGWGK